MFPSSSRRGSAPALKTVRVLRWGGWRWSLLASTVLIVTCVVGPSSLTGTTERIDVDRLGSSGGDAATLTSASTLPPLQLPRDYEVTCGDQLWHGSFDGLKHNRANDNDDRHLSPPVSIAISYCEASLDWFQDVVRDLNVRRVTVYSKCGNPVKGLPPGAEVVELPNVGRVDHSYTYHLAHLPVHTDPNEIQLFMKDTHMAFHHWELRQQPLRDVVEEAAGFTGYSCGRIPNWQLTFDKNKFLSKAWFHTLFNYKADWSFWHSTSELEKYSLESYKSNGNYEARDEESFAGNLTFMDWWDGLGVRIPGPIMPVCYAGVFAAKPANIIASRAVWNRMLKLLERGDNIVEGHYAERTYGAVLLPALPPGAVKRVQCLSRSIRRCSHTMGYCGTLYGCSSNRDC